MFLFSACIICQLRPFSDNNQPNVCLNLNCDLLLKQNSIAVLIFTCLTPYESENVIVFLNVTKNTNACHLEVGFKRKLAQLAARRLVVYSLTQFIQLALAESNY